MTNNINKTGTNYTDFKSGVLNSSFLKKEVSLGELTLLSDSLIRYKDLTMEMTETAFKSLIKLLGLTQGTVKAFGSILSPDFKMKILELMRTACATDSKKAIVCLMCNSNGLICDIRRSKNDVVLTNSAFLTLFEEVIAMHPGMEIKTMAFTKAGNVEITVVNRYWEFNIGGLKDEYFNTGMTFINTPDGCIINPFNERLTCTNGMVTQAKGMSLELRNSDVTSMNGFFDAVRKIKNMDYFQTEFKKRAMIMMKTVASYAEMKNAHSCVVSHIDLHNMYEMDAQVVRAKIENFIPVHYVESQYLKANVDLASLDKKIWADAKTNQTVWEVVNAVTDISSHSDRYNMPLVNGTNSVFAMQKMAGELTFKEKYDLETVLPNIIF